MKNFKILALTLSLYAGQVVSSPVAQMTENKQETLREKAGRLAQKTVGATQIIAGAGVGLFTACFAKWHLDSDMSSYRMDLNYHKRNITDNASQRAIEYSRKNVRKALMTVGRNGTLYAGALGLCACMVYNGISRFKNNTLDTTKKACA